MHKTDDQQSGDAALIQSNKIKSARANHVRNQNDNGGKELHKRAVKSGYALDKFIQKHDRCVEYCRA